MREREYAREGGRERGMGGREGGSNGMGREGQGMRGKQEGTHPQFLANEIAVEVVDDVWILVLLHHYDLVDNELLLGLLREVHLFDGDLAAR